MESNKSFDKLGIQRIEVRTHRPCRRITSAITPMTMHVRVDAAAVTEKCSNFRAALDYTV
jgi:hypothetical protein